MSRSALQIIILCLVFTGSICVLDYYANTWDYKMGGNRGPDKWNQLFFDCGGSMQSPIDIVIDEVLYEGILQPFDFSDYKSTDGLKMKILNLGTRVQLDIKERSVYLTGGSLPGKYKLLHISFHWGRDSSTGSEHTLNGRKFAMEMQMIHVHSRLESSDSASEKPAALAILAFFIEVGNKNDNFQPILNKLSEITLPVFPSYITDVDPFPPFQLLPNSAETKYFRYQGSQTGPPCHESVIWTVSNAVIQLSEEQISMFRALKDDYNNSLVDNYRVTQMLNHRTVLTSDRKYTNQTTPRCPKPIAPKCSNKTLPLPCPEPGHKSLATISAQLPGFFWLIWWSFLTPKY